MRNCWRVLSALDRVPKVSYFTHLAPQPYNIYLVFPFLLLGTDRCSVFAVAIHLKASTSSRPGRGNFLVVNIIMLRYRRTTPWHLFRTIELSPWSYCCPPYFRYLWGRATIVPIVYRCRAPPTPRKDIRRRTARWQLLGNTSKSPARPSTIPSTILHPLRTTMRAFHGMVRGVISFP